MEHWEREFRAGSLYFDIKLGPADTALTISMKIYHLNFLMQNTIKVFPGAGAVLRDVISYI